MQLKTVSRNKLLHCFRPTVDVDMVINEPASVTDRSGENVDDHDVKVSGSGCSIDSKKSSKIIRQLGRIRTFSRVVKAVVFETVLAKRVRDKKGFSKKLQSLDLGGTDEPMILAPKNVVQEMIKTKVTTCISSCSLSSTTKSFVSSKSLSESMKERGHKTREDDSEKPHFSINTGLCLLLLSLTATVLWGRLSAIVFTSIWLCCLPLSSYAGNRGQQDVTKSPEIKSEDHKRKAVNGRDCLKGSIGGKGKKGIEFLT